MGQKYLVTSHKVALFDSLTSQKVALFDSLVTPILNYGAEILEHNDSLEIELVHTKFCRKLLCVKRSKNRNTLYGELCRLPMHINRKIIMIKYRPQSISTAKERYRSTLHMQYNSAFYI